MLIFCVPSNNTPLIVLAVANFVEVAALPVSIWVAKLDTVVFLLVGVTPPTSTTGKIVVPTTADNDGKSVILIGMMLSYNKR